MPSYRLTADQFEGLRADFDSLEKDTALSEKYAAQIKPLIRKDGVLYTIEMPELWSEAFNWSPKIIDKVDANKLRLVAAVDTYHLCGYHMFVKPSVGEVFAQVPVELFSQITAFECLTDDASVEIISENGWYGHKLTTLFYGDVK